MKSESMASDALEQNAYVAREKCRVADVACLLGPQTTAKHESSTIILRAQRGALAGTLGPGAPALVMNEYVVRWRTAS